MITFVLLLRADDAEYVMFSLKDASYEIPKESHFHYSGTHFQSPMPQDIDAAFISGGHLYTFTTDNLYVCKDFPNSDWLNEGIVKCL